MFILLALKTKKDNQHLLKQVTHEFLYVWKHSLKLRMIGQLYIPWVVKKIFEYVVIKQYIFISVSKDYR